MTSYARTYITFNINVTNYILAAQTYVNNIVCPGRLEWRKLEERKEEKKNTLWTNLEDGRLEIRSHKGRQVENRRKMLDAGIGCREILP